LIPNKKLKPTILILIAAVLCGCASEPFPASTTQLSRSLVDERLINGKTTKAAVIALLGEPKTQMSGNFGAGNVEIWSYAQAFHRDINAYIMGYNDIEISSLSITFDSAGRVTGHTFITTHS
jgi:outer membrane protein assembly factor BamE (lipoprotein component of BamABCDE complex)